VLKVWKKTVSSGILKHSPLKRRGAGRHVEGGLTKGDFDEDEIDRGTESSC
jgi:hypothetical protein